MKNTLWLLTLISMVTWAKDDKAPGHHHLLYYLHHANFNASPFRGPNCRISYPPKLKAFEFAQ
jgi:hypothetical protein